jgi:beta-lactamase class C
MSRTSEKVKYLRSVMAVLIIALTGGPAGVWAATDNEVERIVARDIQELMPADAAGGTAVVVRIDGRTLFFNSGYADLASKRPVTSDALFNLASVTKAFDATLLAHAVQRGELAFDDPVAKYVVELRRGGDIRRVTLGQLASFSSGLLLPEDRPPWPEGSFTEASFIARLNEWALEDGRQPGKQVNHASSGFILLRIALERRFGVPFGELMAQRLLKPLGLASTALPVPAADSRAYPRGQLPSALVRRAVQGYGQEGTRIGEPGDLQGYYHWLGAGQIYSSALDMGVFLAANLGELPHSRPLQDAMKLTQEGVVRFSERSVAALAWERHRDAWEIVDRYGGMNNASAMIALIPKRRLGVVILGNRGGQGVDSAAHAILLRLANR